MKYKHFLNAIPIFKWKQRKQISSLKQKLIFHKIFWFSLKTKKDGMQWSLAHCGIVPLKKPTLFLLQCKARRDAAPTTAQNVSKLTKTRKESLFFAEVELTLSKHEPSAL